jgi:hypothetical protein
MKVTVLEFQLIVATCTSQEVQEQLQSQVQNKYRSILGPGEEEDCKGSHLASSSRWYKRLNPSSDLGEMAGRMNMNPRLDSPSECYLGGGVHLHPVGSCFMIRKMQDKHNLLQACALLQHQPLVEILPILLVEGDKQSSEARICDHDLELLEIGGSAKRWKGDFDDPRDEDQGGRGGSSLLNIGHQVVALHLDDHALESFQRLKEGSIFGPEKVTL